MSNFAQGKRAWAISQRSGLRFPYNEMIKEEGTGYFIHRSESDGEYNAVTHPQQRLKTPKPDKQSLPYVSGDYGYLESATSFLTDESGDMIVFLETFGVELAIVL